MKTGMNIVELANEVTRQTKVKRDLLVESTAMQMVHMDGFADNVAIVVATSTAVAVERFEITETAHRQLSSWVGVPWMYYKRLLADHPDLVMHQVNELFKREPGTRMLRTLDQKCRAFLSDRYKRLDNDAVLAQTLPVLMNGDQVPAHDIIANHITDDVMKLRVVWTDPSLAQDIGEAPRRNNAFGQPQARDIIYPGFEISNSETGNGTLNIRGFFYRSYCTNGCVWGTQDADIRYSRKHLGGKLSSVGVEILSDETKRKEDEANIAVIGDIMKAMGTPSTVQKLGDQLRAMKQGEQIKNPVRAVEVAAKELKIQESESEVILQNLIADGDFSRYGLMNAITQVANRDNVTQDRAFELEEIGSSLMTIQLRDWSKIANAEKVAA